MISKHAFQLQAQGHEVLLSIDANESLEQRNSKILKFAKETELHDIIHSKHGISGEPFTHNRGSKRIDFFFATASLLSYINQSGILPFEELAKSDHRFTFVDIDLFRYLRGTDASPQLPDPRYLRSNNPEIARKYCNEMTKRWQDLNIDSRLDNCKLSLQLHGCTPTAIEQLESIDRDIVRSQLAAERKLGKEKAPWSPQLRRAQSKVRYFEMWLTELKTGIDLAAQRESVAQWMHAEDVPTVTLTLA